MLEECPPNHRAEHANAAIVRRACSYNRMRFLLPHAHRRDRRENQERRATRDLSRQSCEVIVTMRGSERIESVLLEEIALLIKIQENSRTLSSPAVRIHTV